MLLRPRWLCDPNWTVLPIRFQRCGRGACNDKRSWNSKKGEGIEGLLLCQSLPSKMLFCSFYLQACYMLYDYDWLCVIIFRTLEEQVPECVARVPVSLWGSGGGGVFAWCCPTVRNRSQPFATVRNRSQPSVWGPYGRAYRKFYRSGHFRRFHVSRSFVSCGRRGTSWHVDVFGHVSNLVLRGRRNTFARFSEHALQFPWQAQHFGRVQLHFSWQAQHFRRVVLCFLAKSHWQGCAKWWQSANCVAGVAFCAMWWNLAEASHETSILMWQIFGFLWKLVGKRRFLTYNLPKLQKVSHEMLVLGLQHV